MRSEADEGRPPTAEAAGAPLLRLEGITKVFPGVVANSDIDLDLRGGEIHCLLGENGAGKSTLMGIVYGLYRPDGGRVVLDGREVALSSPRDALALGIGFVQQHFSLIPTLTVAQNLALSLRHGDAAVTFRDAAQTARRLSEKYGLRVDPDATIEKLGVGRQQYAELLKALARNVRILILDEPASVLTPQEADRLAEVLHALKDDGVGILLISHNLDEVLRVADRITVLRGGRKVATIRNGEADRGQLAKMMVGELAPTRRPGEPQVSDRAGDVRLRAADLWVRDDRDEWAVRGVEVELRAGEILGVAGVEGNGQLELTEALTGVRPSGRGTIEVMGKALGHADARRLIDEYGVAHVPADRQRSGFVGDLSVAMNLCLPVVHRPPFSRGGVLQVTAIRDRARTLIGAFDIRVATEDVPAGTLSGGNQQKMILARELSRDPGIVIACYATRGLDIAAAQAVHEAMRAARAAGAAILFASVELNELLLLSDRIVVLRNGAIAGEVTAEDATAEQLGLWMGGAGTP